MDVRLLRAALVAVFMVVAARSATAASYRTQNFLVTAATPQLAKDVGDSAEQLRRDLALSWLGHELPAWLDPCPITVYTSPNLLASGVTEFYFDRGRPHRWTMKIQGTTERVLDSVLPHEVLHTVFATHFGGPLPRWADEGACTTVEDIAERSKQERLLIKFLTTDKGIPFNKMFAMREYPTDMLPLYSQGYALARFLVALGGRQRFVAFVGEGMKTNNWHKAIHDYYGFDNLSDLQVQWLAWVRDGGQDAVASQYRKSTPVAAATVSGAVAADNQFAATTSQTEALVAVPETADPTGWYLRQRDDHRGAHPELMTARQNTPERKTVVVPSSNSSMTSRAVSRPQPLMSVQPTVIEATRAPNRTWR